jgi:hypothetical protein
MKISEPNAAENIRPSAPADSRERPSQQQLQITNSSLHECDWISTSLCLPPLDAHGGDVIYLRLPAHQSEASRLKQHGGEGYINDRYSSENDNRLSLMQLDNYLATIPQLVLSTQRLLHGDSATKHNTSNQHDHGECFRTTLGKGNQNSRSSNDMQMRQSAPPHHRLITSANSGRVINVLQGEIAHCTASQADILVSDGATTCHIVALWSRYIDSKSDEGQDFIDTIFNGSALATLTHIDGPGYERCVRDAIYEHIQYHSGQSWQITDNNYTADVINSWSHQASFGKGIIDISIHVMGGFNDQNGSSIEISSSVLKTFAAVSSECNYNSIGRRLPQIRMTLKTCAVASANDDGSRCPLGRGLGLEVATGSIFLAEVDDIAEDGDIVPGASANDGISAQGPAVTVRSVRLWASSFHLPRSKQENRLIVIHRPDSNFLCIEPFFFGYHINAQRLLDYSDKKLLLATSTSPDVERNNFVGKVRVSLTYMNRNKSEKIFQLGRPIKFKRVGQNGWILITEES